MEARQLKDPAAGVPPQLLPHLHLISKHKYPMLANLQLETIVQFLVEAPKIMREVSAVQWQYLDAPPDGSLFLTWQPTNYMNMNFASDGYVWTDAEQPFNSDVRGYTLQMFWARAGYKPQVESVATHSRRRYRLTNNVQMGMNTVDGDLWLVHYSKAQARDQHPANAVQMLPHITQQFQQRQMIQRGGQLTRKEFMLHDRTQYPIISLPAGVGRTGSSGQTVASHRRGQSLTSQETTLEEEEDVSRGDALDFITPRDISRMRYEQHHEWMEEVLESPYATAHILPSELGLGRKGTLEPFTSGFFAAPVSTTQDATDGTVEKLDTRRADEFTKHANAKLAEMQADLEKMKEQHIRRMEKLRRTTDLGAAERQLRNMNTADDSYKSVAAQVQDLVGRKIEPVQKVTCISKGGYQDIRPVAPIPQESSQQNPAASVQQVLPQTSAQMRQQQELPKLQQQPLQQQQTMQGQHQTGPSHNQQQSQSSQQSPTQTQIGNDVSSQGHATAVTAQSGHSSIPVKSPPLQGSAESRPRIENNDAVDSGDDIDMGDMADSNVPSANGNGDAGDWDMVADHASTDDNQDVEDQQQTAQTQDYSPPTIQPQVQQNTQDSNDTPGDAGDFDMVTDFDTNMDTAGDALADYGADDEELNLDDSAFGDAFHHNQQDMS